MPRPRRPAAPKQLAPNLPVVQLRVRLLGVAPVVWRRLVLDGTATLQELHGILQVAMGWSGIHLYRFEVGAVAFGSPELAIASPQVTLNDLHLRVGRKFRYTYDMGAFWRHEVRVEDHLAADPAVAGPVCIDGDHSCPPEDCGGPEGYRERRREAVGFEAWEDLAEIEDVLGSVVHDRSCAALADPKVMWRLERAAERTQARLPFLVEPFCASQVNERFLKGEHILLMHQQIW